MINNSKPTCLIIDEIDGASGGGEGGGGGGFVRELIKLIEARGKKGKGKEKGKELNKEGVLLRPIICICNDLYVSLHFSCHRSHLSALTFKHQLLTVSSSSPTSPQNHTSSSSFTSAASQTSEMDM